VSDGWASFLFSLELSYLAVPKKARLAEPWRFGDQLSQNLLLSALSLCRMVLHGLESLAAPLHRIGQTLAG
jgi:hypothetical protein